MWVKTFLIQRTQVFEFHGWFNISESAHFIEKDETTLIAREIKKHIAALGWGNGENNVHIDILGMNGSFILRLSGVKNHRGVIYDEVDQLLNWIVKLAPGSYGLLYWRDDEGDTPAGPDNFQVKVMSRGQIVTRFDPFLSPFFPVVEDFCDSG
jgi:Immunity protein 7